MHKHPLDPEHVVHVDGEDFEVTAVRESGEFVIARVRDDRSVACLKRDGADGRCVAHRVDETVTIETIQTVVASARGRGLVPESTSDAIVHR
jgi:hypothetical protein